MNRALLVGINDYRHQPLAGCVPDVEDLATYLVSERGYAHESVVPLHDARATKAAIVRSLRELVAASLPGDHILFHFSGHGTLMAAQAPEEQDALEEVLCPVDFDWSAETALTENHLRAILATVPAEVAMTLVIDACQSGELERLMPRESDRARYFRPPSDVLWRMSSRRRVVRRIRSISQRNVAMVAACAASECAADSRFSGWANGAFSHYWLRELGHPREHQPVSLEQLVARVAGPLGGYQMHPVLSAPPELKQAPFLAHGVFANKTLTPVSVPNVPVAVPVRGIGNGSGGVKREKMEACGGLRICY